MEGEEDFVETVKQIKKDHYEKHNRRYELKSKNILPAARRDLLQRACSRTKVTPIAHIIYKPAIYSKTFLEDHTRFYRNCYSNFVSNVFEVTDGPIAIITDQHHHSEEAFRHFENCINYVNGYKIERIYPARSSQTAGLQVADIIIGTVKRYLENEMKNQDHVAAYEELRPHLHKSEAIVFPKSHRWVGRMGQL